MKELSPKQLAVLAEAKRRLEIKPWYNGVCLDNFPSEASILREGHEKAVQDVVLETSFWDAPGFVGYPNKPQPNRLL